jgi:polyhydroxybutyrate depolymerase
MRIDRRLGYITAVLSLLLGTGISAFAANPENASSGERQTLNHEGLARTYVVRTPSGLAQHGGRVPLVLVLHGGGGNAGNAESMTGFSEKAEKEGFIVVYPEGTGRFRKKHLTWNAGHCCGIAMKRRVNDVGFIDTLIDKLLVDYPVDPKRIYATGMSNGGMMTHRLGIELSDRFAAIAPVVATLFGDEIKPMHPVSALMFNGLRDKSVPHAGGPPCGRFPSAWDGTPTKPALEQAEFWANTDGCTTDFNRIDREQYIWWQYRCPAGRAVEMYLLKDAGHAWPGGQRGSRMGDKPSTALNATDLIWAFFRAHSK